MSLPGPFGNAGRGSTPAGASGQRTMSFLQFMLVAWDCILLGIQPVLVHLSKVDGAFLYSPVAVNFLTEVSKCFIAISILIFKKSLSNHSPEAQLFSLKGFARNFSINAALAVPAALYAVNNYLKFVLQLYFDPVTVKMFSNLKVFMIALLLNLFLKRNFTTLQWQALTLLVLGISVNQFTCQMPHASIESSSSWLGYFYTLVSVSAPSVASVYNEYALKRDYETSVHIQNFFQYLYGAIFNAAILVLWSAYENIFLKSTLQNSDWRLLLNGHNIFTFFIIINSSLQGILSSFFFKYADTILKKYSSSIATILTGLASAAVLGRGLSADFCLGVTIVLISLHQFYVGGNSKGKVVTQVKDFVCGAPDVHAVLHPSGSADMLT